MKSIIQNRRECLLCGSTQVEEHHIFGAFNRKKSEKYGLKVWLCRTHHNDAHSPSSGVPDYLHRLGQIAFSKTYNEDFLSIFGRNYL